MRLRLINCVVCFILLGAISTARAKCGNNVCEKDKGEDWNSKYTCMKVTPIHAIQTLLTCFNGPAVRRWALQTAPTIAVRQITATVTTRILGKER